MQGVSSAGKQRGMKDERSGLVKQPFRVYDELDDHSASEAHFLCGAIFFLLLFLDEFEAIQYAFICLDALCQGRD